MPTIKKLTHGDESSHAELKASHTPDAISERLDTGVEASYLRDFVYGAVDGTVTTFAVVAGVVGADLDTVIIVILGLVNLLADGFSMSVSGFLGHRAEMQQRERARRVERRHIARYPEGEREEIRQIFMRKGFTDETLDRVVDRVTSDPELWIDTMLAEEFGIHDSSSSPLRAALVIFAAFLSVGLIPLLPYIVVSITGSLFMSPWLLTCVLTAVAFAIVGARKADFVEQSRWRGALETVAVGGAAAALAYGVGHLLSGLAG